MATLDDKLLGEKIHNYCSSSSEDEDDALKFIPEASINESTHKMSVGNGGTTNTGPKGVIKDWQKFKQLETEKRDEQDGEKLKLLKKLSLSARTYAEDAEAKQQEELDAELAELMSDDFLLEYQKKRMAEMMALSGMIPQFGSLIDLNNGDDFLNAIDNENQNVTIIIHIYEKNDQACKAMNRGLKKLAEEYKNVKFCKIISMVAGMSNLFKSSGVPAILIYKAGQVIGNFVRISDDLGDEFYHTDVESFLIEHGLLPDKSCVPMITASANYGDDE